MQVRNRGRIYRFATLALLIPVVVLAVETVVMDGVRIKCQNTCDINRTVDSDGTVNLDIGDSQGGWFTIEYLDSNEPIT